MSVSQSTTNWAKSFICQKETKENLQSTDDGRKSLASLSPKFASKNTLGFDINRIQTEREDLEINLNNNNACYHHSYKIVYNNRMYERHLVKEKCKSSLDSGNEIERLPCKRRMSTASSKVTPEEGVDKKENLVAAGTLYATKTKTQIDHLKSMTANWKCSLKSRRCSLKRNALP